MFSYTYSRLWGNYTGLTTTDQNDGGTTGRNSPDTTRAFDEPFYYFTDTGKSNAGPLPTDRPNALKGFVYYSLPWKNNSNTTTIGLFQVAYQGSPVSSYVDLGLAADNEPIEATYIFGHGQFAPITTDASGNVTIGSPHSLRTPWYTQTDLNLSHAIKVNHNNEHQVLTFNATLTNLLNQHAVTSYFEGFDSNWFQTALFPYQGFTGAAFYQTIEEGYNPQAEVNAQAAGTCVYCQIFGQPLPLVKDSQYGQPNLWQLSRNIRVGVQFTF